jgi:hypothetical protein
MIAALVFAGMLQAQGNCPAAFHHRITLTGDTPDTLTITADEPDCSDIRISITRSTGETLFEYHPDYSCATGGAREGFRRAKSIYNGRDPRKDARALPASGQLDTVYYQIPDKTLYERARKTGGPIVCFTTGDNSGACVWHDKQQNRTVILFHEGS